MTETIPTSRVVHVNDAVPGAIYIGRDNGRRGLRCSRWANPFKMISKSRHERERVIMLYRNRLLMSPQLMKDIEELRGKPLACWCRRDGEERTSENVCHGDVLIELMGAQDDD